MEGKISNVAGYRFVDLPDRDELREPFRAICKKAGLKGTVLLSHEGINFFLAGSQSSIDQYLDFLEQDTRFSQMALKYSYTDYLPFNRMNVRLKKEIISLGLDHIKPAEFTGDEITPTEFKQWLDEGREVAIVDTRNDYEIRVGTFHDALDLNIKSFRAFPKAIEALPDSMKDTPVVMFCTGGI
ncbi:MAG: pseudouridine synthase, partial [Euryarchaeota archaeon]|nr:pseudouridine synthase [Euryarchaeota archaeon]